MQPAIQCVPGAGSPQAQWLESEADHLPLVPRLEWVELYLHSHICLHGMHKDNCTFTSGYVLTK